VFLLYNEDDDHGIRRANMVQALAQFWCLWASHEATDMLYQSMSIAPYQPGCLGGNVGVVLGIFSL
jgi:hypothetical protein